VPRILIADDHGLYRKGVRAALEAAIPDIDVLEADCMQAALSQIEMEGDIDLTLVDLHMPGLATFENLRAASEQYPRTRFVVLSASEAKADVLSSLAAGLHGFISKRQSDEEIIAAVVDVMAGRIYVPPWLVQLGPSAPNEYGAVSDWGVLKPASPSVKLTARQREVLQLLARGLSNKEIARALSISEATAKVHAAGLLRILAVRNRTQAAVAARELIDQDGAPKQ